MIGQALAAVLLLLFTVVAFAGTPPEAADERDEETGNFIDRTHQAWSRRVTALGVMLDRLFGGEDFIPDHSSYIRTRSTLLLREQGSDLEFRLRARVTLPNTERRLSLILESEDDHRFDRAAGPEPAPPALLRSSGDSGFTAGLRYLKDLSDAVNLDVDAGVRLRRALPDPFVRVRLGRSFYPGAWEVRPSEELYWREHRGAGARTVLLVQRPLPGPRFFRAVSEYDWVYRERRAYLAHDFIVTHQFDPLHAVQANIGLRGETDTTRLESWFVNIGWRRNVYKSWLFVELRPEVLFERERDFQGEPRLFFTLEAYFGDMPWPKTEG